MKEEIKKYFYTMQEAESSLGIKRTAIYKEIKEGRLESKLYGNKRLITTESIQAWANNLRVDFLQGVKNV